MKKLYIETNKISDATMKRLQAMGYTVVIILK